ncbi:hypothetical protein [Aliikangiella coralliicola]|uniref:CBU-0592-like domain-containing protein n=1 Tax=Aliikangiella coralliicola TaxID=2592383 RepID=A0A545U4E1_9GAMM|nr:hypothetical protein [Aliikangiella coralliicola]TQV84347.1 hypothetical protein FLL46_22240 [Aliikangiella coralliicola]
MNETNLLIYLSGWLGVSLILVGFSLNVLVKRFTSESKTFLIVNFLGASLLVANSYFSELYHYTLLNAFWATVAVVGLIKNHATDNADAKQ